MQGGFHTRKEAQEALTKVLNDLREGTYIQPSKVVLSEFLRDVWLPAIPSTIRESTLSSYKMHVERHISPPLGTLRLRDITGATINSFYLALSSDGRCDETGGLSPATVRRIHATLHGTLRDAVKWGYLLRNPADAAEPPKPSSEPRAMNAWDAKELRKFLEAAHDDRLYPLWHVLAYTGMRRGEALGLLWRDVDFESARISVSRSHIIVNGKLTVSEPKTARGRRVIDLDGATVLALSRQAAQQADEHHDWDAAWAESDLVFTQESGEPLYPSKVSRAFAAVIKRAKVRAIPLHGLRHTHASLSLQAGVPAKVISERLGHATIAITMDIYSHVVPGMQAEAAERFAALMAAQQES